MPSPLGDALNGYDIEWVEPKDKPHRNPFRTVLVKCASDGAVRAGATIALGTAATFFSEGIPGPSGDEKYPVS